MGQLHEVLAVESDLEGVYLKIIEETKVNFTKHPDRYFEQVKTVKYLTEEDPNVKDTEPKEAPVRKAMDDTVPAKLKYTSESIVRFLDAVLQKETTNQNANAHLVVDDDMIASDVPVTFLLGLEAKLKFIRDKIIRTIPTLQPGIAWEKDPTHEFQPYVYKRKYSEEAFRTKKNRKNHVLAEATDKHPAQVEVYTEDDKVARVITDTWVGVISPAEKSLLLERIDKLIRATKVARQKANETEVEKVHIGEYIFKYLFDF